ncbi:Phenylalanine--trna ligase alpha subunit like [Thalictrum thalictroides]|uniref:phenylalanine--tRNA ligase n=1 Tax=Thalictrum thalictroides TaxID=46969 RepID=A0A7J6WA73_THATH|nr:Phenylalanine--trna ligase alpha subunit like [Thalictrum thalictroides]
MAEKAILEQLQSNEEISNSGDFATSTGFDHEEIKNITRSLHGFQLVDAQEIKKEIWELTNEGKLYAEIGSPEFQLFSAVPPEGGISRQELQQKFDPLVYKIGCQAAVKNKWLEMGRQQVLRKIQTVEDSVKDLLLQIKDGQVISSEDINSLKRRKLIELKTWNGYSIRKGPNFSLERKKLVSVFTREHLLSGEWKNLEFKKYNFDANALPPSGGHLHPLLKVRERIRNIFIAMGFKEMQTNNYVESSFWNFDALFQPQQHPARDSHDTFFLKAPSTTLSLPESYLDKVKQVHESGGYGSKGYQYEWKREEAEKNVFRTHTTAVTARVLYSLAQQRPFTPQRYFSIDRVFRNEAVDRTHLAEFHQIEGVICDRGLTLADLMQVLQDFFKKMGMSNLKFKATCNPYTEPSMEIYSYHEGLKKWVEIGNSGMFRPEMLRPMGFPEDVTAIAWGLSLERPTMILYGIDNIRDLFGPKVDLKLIKRNPICKLGM